jgi:parvulin-like peptidyl-prolyl isomerase
VIGSLLFLHGANTHGQAGRQFDKAVVIVNGTPIRESQIVAEADNRINVNKVRDAAKGLIFEESAREAMRAALREEIIHSLAERVLIADQLNADGIKITDAEVDARFAEKAQTLGQTAAEAEHQVVKQERKLADVKARIRWNELGVEKLYAAHATDKMVLTEKEAHKIYSEYPAEFDRPETRRVSHLLVRANSEDSTEKKQAARAKAESLLMRIRAGEDFAALARQLSEDEASKTRGGDRGWSTRGIIFSEADDPFGNVAFAMKHVGQVSDVVETRDGYHIIKLTDLKEARRLPFEEVKDQLIADFRHREIGAFWDRFGGRLWAKARIEYSPDELDRRAERKRQQQKLNEEMERLIARERAKQQARNAGQTPESALDHGEQPLSDQ